MLDALYAAKEHVANSIAFAADTSSQSVSVILWLTSFEQQAKPES